MDGWKKFYVDPKKFPQNAEPIALMLDAERTSQGDDAAPDICVGPEVCTSCTAAQAATLTQRATIINDELNAQNAKAKATRN